MPTGIKKSTRLTKYGQPFLYLKGGREADFHTSWSKDENEEIDGLPLPWEAIISSRYRFLQVAPFRQSLLVLESCANERCIRNRNGLVSEQLGLLGTDIPRGMRDLHSGIHEPSGNGKFGTRICFKFQW